MSNSSFKSFKLITELFSINPKNMRFPYFKRIVVVILFVPFFSLLFIINNFFLFIDNILFYKFKRVEIKQPVFIVSMPRTGTTMLLHMLSSFKTEFTTMKLWELLFAPSITQKLIFLGVNKFDKYINSIIKKTIIFFSDIVFKNLTTLHNTGLEQPEEDELILLWSLSSGYFQYFYPESKNFDDFLDFDNQVNPKQKKRIMKRYFRLVQRHNYVFNYSEKRTFISKNPFMLSKIESLHDQFNDAKILTINRCPNLIINSVINLNKLIFNSFSSFKIKSELKTRTIDLIKNWYFHSNKKFKANPKIHHLYLDFEKLIKKDKDEFKTVFNFLNLNESFLTDISNKSYQNYKSKPKKTPQLKKYIEKDEIPFMKEYYKELI